MIFAAQFTSISLIAQLATFEDVISYWIIIPWIFPFNPKKNAIQSHWFPSMKSHWKFHIMKIHENQWKSMNITEHQPFSIIFSYRDQLFFQVRKLYASGLKAKFFPSDQVPWQSSGTSLGVPKGSRVSVDAMCLFFIAWLMDEFKKDLSNLFQSYFYFF